MEQRSRTLETMGLNAAQIDPEFWCGKRVLVTGHTGFKGAWLSFWLQRMGAHVFGLALPPCTQPNLFDLLKLAELVDSRLGDIRDQSVVSRRLAEVDPQIIFHMAAQPLVRAGYREPVDTFNTNVMGTAHVLNAMRDCKHLSAAVMVTTDKVYRNNEWAWPYRETDALGGYDPYSASKAASELVIDCFRQSFLNEAGVRLASARAGNVIGGGDWSEDRLIPDAVRAWQQGGALEIRRPDAVRPWQHVLDPLAGYMVLAQQLWSHTSLPSSFNFGPASHEAYSVRTVIDQALQAYGQGKVNYADTVDGPHEAGLLKLDVSQTAGLLGFESRFTLQSSVEKTMHWYRMQHQGVDATSLCEDDIRAYGATE